MVKHHPHRGKKRGRYITPKKLDGCYLGLYDSWLPCFESKPPSSGLVKQLNNGSRWQHGAHLCKVTDLHENDLIPHGVRVLWLHLWAFKIDPKITQLWKWFPTGLSIDAVGNWTKNGTCRGIIQRKSAGTYCTRKSHICMHFVLDGMHSMKLNGKSQAAYIVDRRCLKMKEIDNTEGGRSGMKQFHKLGKGQRRQRLDSTWHWSTVCKARISILPMKGFCQMFARGLYLTESHFWSMQ